MDKVKKVILPGSYDPITRGHLEIVKLAAKEYEEVMVVGFINPEKTYLFSEEERLEMLKIATRGMDNVRVDFSEGLLIDYMKRTGCELIVKGYRNEIDYQYELKMASWNEEHGGYKTRLIKCKEQFENISSTAAREAIKSGDRLLAERVLAKDVAEYIFDKFRD